MKITGKRSLQSKLARLAKEMDEDAKRTDDPYLRASLDSISMALDTLAKYLTPSNLV